jgi:hypothetical protein|tara:strand:+ start:2105 stop:2560 length:456 start_codon:yes stop_codon:yes gene_type:complete
MPCGQYNYGLCRTNRQRGVSSRPSIGRLSYLQRQTKPMPTRNYGSEDARSRAIRRRVARIKTSSTDQYGNPVKYGYGPLFGLRKGVGNTWLPSGQCNYVFSANGGSGSDVAYWKRVMGGSMNIVTSGSGDANGNCSFVACNNAGVKTIGTN